MGDQDSRKKKGAFGGMKLSRNSHYDPPRRKLKSYPLNPPKYAIELEYLDMGVEYEVKFAGVIENFPLDVDITNRTDVLCVIDKSKRQKRFPHYVTSDHDSIFGLSMENITISRREHETTLLKIQITEIAAICYIREEGLHILSIKYGSPESCDLAVVYCESQELAEGICAFFQVVFTEAVMKLLVKLFDRIESMPPSTVSQSDTENTCFTSEDPSHSVATRITTHNRAPQRSGSTISSTSQTADLLLQSYMQQLKEKLSPWELQNFAALLQSNSEPFQQYCEKIFDLYGPDRTYLLNGLRPFIHAKDVSSFDEFLRKKGIAVKDSVHGSFKGNYERSSSEVSTGSSFANYPEVMTVLDDLKDKMDEINTSLKISDTTLKISPGHMDLHYN